MDLPGLENCKFPNGPFTAEKIYAALVKVLENRYGATIKYKVVPRNSPEARAMLAEEAAWKAARAAERSRNG